MELSPSWEAERNHRHEDLNSIVVVVIDIIIIIIIIIIQPAVFCLSVFCVLLRTRANFVIGLCAVTFARI
jgi:hypothetical protein